MRELAVQDWAIVAFLCLLLFAGLQGVGPDRPACIAAIGALLVAFVLALWLVRGHVIEGRWAPGVTYRFATVFGVQLTYFVLRKLLPTANARSLDAELYRLDLVLFGVEPTLWADRFITPGRTEWFSFFYLSYFALLAIQTLPVIFLERRSRILAEFATAMLFQACATHLLYILVPGFGPIKFLSGQFPHALPSGYWYDLVVNTVNTGGAQKDIFPSLHTGAPAAMALFSIRNRHARPYKYTWPVVTFFAVNIIGATIYLRWHYLVDVLAGLSLALIGARLATTMSRWEPSTRRAQGKSPVWPPLPERASPEA